MVEDQPKTPSGLFDADDRGDLFNANEPSKPVEVKQAKKAKKKVTTVCLCVCVCVCVCVCLCLCLCLCLSV